MHRRLSALVLAAGAALAAPAFAETVTYYLWDPVTRTYVPRTMEATPPAVTYTAPPAAYDPGPRVVYADPPSSRVYAAPDIVVTAPRSYPLRRLSARRLVAPRIALVGDAGHVIHPLAGQGLNLGLQDARALAEVLAQRGALLRDPGDLRLLRRYERSRAEPILAMDTMVDGLYTLFGTHNRLAGRLRNAGLNLTDRIPVLKNLLIRQALH